MRNNHSKRYISMVLSLAFIIGYSFANITIAETVSPRDFQYNIQLSPQNKSSLFKFPLPKHVYLNSNRHNLHDVLIFNSIGEIVPMEIEDIPPMEIIEQKSYSIPFFKTFDAIQEASDINLSVTTSNNQNPQNNVNVRIKNPSEIATEQTIYIDTQKIDNLNVKLNKLVLDWQFKIPGNYIFNVSVDDSSNLINWHYNSRSKLIDFNTGDTTIVENTVILSPTNHRFLRLIINADQTTPHVNAIRGEVSRTTKVTQQRWHTVKLTPSFDNKHDYTFDLSGNFIINALRITPKENNDLYTASIYSRNTNKNHWHYITKDDIYTITNEKNRVSNHEISFYNNSNPHWMVRFDQLFNTNKSSLNKSDDTLPLVEFSWRPHEVIFLAKGKGPYTLAYGKADLDNKTQSPPLLERLKIHRQDISFNHELQISAPHKNLITPKKVPEKPFWEKYKTHTLWVIIISFVMLMLYIASKLFNEIKQQKPTDK